MRDRSGAALETVAVPVYGTGETLHFPVLRHIARRRSAHQDIAVVETAAFGRCLVLNGSIQTAQSDHGDYDAALLRDLAPDTQTLLVIGGGDGCVAATALARQPFLRVTVAEIDPAVAALCNQHFTPGVFDDARVSLVTADVLDFQPAGLFDGIVGDLSDEPVHASGGESVMRLYDTLIARIATWLKPGGWLALQAGAETVRPGLLDLAALIEDRVHHTFGTATRDAVLVPSYGEKNAFVYARKG